MSLFRVWRNFCTATLLANISLADLTERQTPRPTGHWLSPEYKWIFEYPLPIASVKSPKQTFKAPSGADIDYYEVELKSHQKQIYPNLPPTDMTGYDGMSPGPMFIMQKGREAVIRFSNNGPSDMSVHVHGQYNRAPFDGWAADTADPGQYKDYYYPNAQNARTIWYHDHSEFTTGEHTYHGQSGFYILTDPEEQALGLPNGGHDITLSLDAKVYHANGSLNYDTNNNAGLWGDIIQVNWQPWPHHKVEPRKYRLRFLNGAVSRTFSISFTPDSRPNSKIDFHVIGSDGGLFSGPVRTNNLALSMGERYETIVDFSNYKGQNVTIYNSRGMGENADYAATDLVMRFVVGDTVTDNTNNGPVPSYLHNVPAIPANAVAEKNFAFDRVGDKWVINGVGWADIEHRILTKPKLGNVEIWTLTNGNGGGTHPVHIHLVDFQVLSRTGGRNTVLPYESAGLKDVVWLAGGETVRVVARYAPWAGLYMFHCHNLVHEDHDMLVSFNVSTLSQWGYSPNETIFIDPLTPEFRPKPIVGEDFTDAAIQKKLQWFYDSDAYKRGNLAAVYSGLDAGGGGGGGGGGSGSATATAQVRGKTRLISRTLGPQEVQRGRGKRQRGASHL
ncbi:hypothetical protein P154DRAFT_318772 [Amniculicola lignicola CBS 123094]|uniref:Cupredoxin n=1 Tax=Amniculicola lignicola CBS 123094 TaxID=1392246 RepID=A0A6A5WXA0_9PLEO|nr:hypothetical protein P154DRAFT_318772 [Amniculicola lignicola CBS 123094]